MSTLSELRLDAECKYLGRSNRLVVAARSLSRVDSPATKRLCAAGDGILDPLEVFDKLVIVIEVQVSLISLVANPVHQMLKEMAHAVALRVVIREMWNPLLHPVGEISHRLRWSLIAIHIARPSDIGVDSVLELVNKEGTESVVGDRFGR